MCIPNIAGWTLLIFHDIIEAANGPFCLGYECKWCVPSENAVQGDEQKADRTGRVSSGKVAKKDLQ